MSMLINPHRFGGGGGGGGGGDSEYANVKLLLHFDGADASTTFTDNAPTPYAPDTKAGNVQISTTQSKFGGASGKFDGTGDYLVYASDVSRFYFASLDFCIEARVFISTTGREQVLVDFRGAWLAEGIALFLTTGDKLKFFAGDANPAGWEVIAESSGAAMSGSTWYSVAVTRSGSTFRLFVDGVIVASATWAGGIAYSATPRLTIGNWFNTSAGGDFAGYIDELRITIGSARYTANYTPATEAFPNS